MRNRNESCNSLNQGCNKYLFLFLWAASFTISNGNALISPLSLKSYVHAPVNELRVKGCFDAFPSSIDALSARGGCDLNAESEEDGISEVSVSDDSDAVGNEKNLMGPNSSTPGFLRKLLPSLPWYKVPNWLTYARCIAIPALIVQFYIGQCGNKNIHSSLIFAIASITDFLDGYLARRWDICSPFGAFLDPVADKLMVSTALILLSGKYGSFVAVPSAIILAREISVSALREWMASRGQRDTVKVGFQGKVCTIQLFYQYYTYSIFSYRVQLNLNL